ncbi:MAG: DUF1385 domain-containing protein [Oscillospiraceae bacterium]|jgi:uncharacterized protein YqhQ|nr:DUF1385 domain-containing protein [Oscillospiraceae bacterium]
MKEKTKEFQTTIGGQALIEGILMRGPKKQAMVVRTPDGLVKKVEELKFIKDKYPILGLPFIRGVVNFGGAMSAGVRAIFFAVEQLPDDEQYEQESKFDRWLERKFGKDEKGQKALMTLVTVFAIAISVGLFILLPTLLAGIVARFVQSSVWRNVIEGVIRVAIFLGYLAAVSRMPDIQRVFRYHGAEHKTIFCYEKGLPLTVENVRTQQKEHPRCGTSFLFVVMIVSIIVFSVVTWSNPFIRIVLRLALLPVVVAISYEFNRIVGRHCNWFTNILSAPGRWLQKLTVYEPDDSMREVAIAAMELVIPEVEGEDRW